MRFVILAAVCLAACDPGSEEAFIDSHLSGDEEPCGDLGPAPDAGADAARQCVADHLASNTPFVLRTVIAYENTDLEATAGERDGGGLQLLSLRTFSDDSGYSAEAYRCDDLIEMTCNESDAEALCYQCVNAVEFDHVR